MTKNKCKISTKKCKAGNKKKQQKNASHRQKSGIHCQKIKRKLAIKKKIEVIVQKNSSH